MLTVKQFAERLGVSPSLIYALCRAGVIGHLRHGRPGKRGCIRIEEAALASYCEASKGAGRTIAPPLTHINRR